MESRKRWRDHVAATAKAGRLGQLGRPLHCLVYVPIELNPLYRAESRENQSGEPNVVFRQGTLFEDPPAE